MPSTGDLMSVNSRLVLAVARLASHSWMVGLGQLDLGLQRLAVGDALVEVGFGDGAWSGCSFRPRFSLRTACSSRALTRSRSALAWASEASSWATAALYIRGSICARSCPAFTWR